MKYEISGFFPSPVYYTERNSELDVTEKKEIHNEFYYEIGRNGWIPSTTHYNLVEDDRVAAVPINRPASFSKELLLKVASAYVELYKNRNDLEVYSHLSCTEGELWSLRQIIPPNVTFNNVSITPILKKKILEGILALNTNLLEETTSKEQGPTKYDVAEDIIEWRRQNP